MMTWTEGMVRANDIDVHYYRTGEGSRKPAVVFLHGVTDSGRCWSRMAHDLEDTYDCVMLDARGHGRSSGIEQGFSLALLAEDVVGAIDVMSAMGVMGVLGIEKPVLYGHSMGALTAIQVAGSNVDLLRGVILEDPPLTDGDSERERRGPDSWQWIIDLKALSHEQLVEKARELNPGWAEEELGPWVESKEQFRVEVLQHIEQIVDIDWRALIARITVPTLLITGDVERGVAVSLKAGEEFLETAAYGEVVRERGAGHNVHRDRYQEVLRAVRDFCMRVSD
jgi:N-formylmaleamate deformylase